MILYYSRLRLSFARILLLCVILEFALEDYVWSIFAESLRVCVVLMIGYVLSYLIGRKPGCRPYPNPPTSLAGAVLLGFIARGSIDLFRFFFR